MPLRWKLVALYAVILTAVIGAICVAVPLGLRHTLLQALDTELEARARTVGAVTELENGRWIVEAKSGIDREFAAGSGRYYVLRDAGGRPLLASPLAQAMGLGGTPSADCTAAPAAEASVSDARERVAFGRRFRELTVAITKSMEEEEAAARGVELRVVCGKDLRDVAFSVDSLIAWLAVLGPLVLLLSLLGGWLLAARALAPIDDMARTAAAIGEQEPARRLVARGRDELSRLAATLNRTFDRLQESLQRQQRFTADASHELRTPLAVVAGSADLALRRPRTADEYRLALSEIQAAASRMRVVVDGLLLLARADAEAIALARVPIRMRQLCEEVVRQHEALAARGNVTVRVTGDDVVLVGDGSRLMDLLGNLLANAIRYNVPGGRVDVRLSRQQATVRIEVEDTGIGIPAEHLPHVFERFYRVDDGRCRDAGGAGLGLAIACWVAPAHGGDIAVASELGRGTTFTVQLPCPSADPQPLR